MRKKIALVLALTMCSFSILCGCSEQSTEVENVNDDSTNLVTESVEDETEQSYEEPDSTDEDITDGNLALDESETEKYYLRIKKETFYRDGNMHNIYEYEYDVNGNLIRESSFDENHREYDRKIYEYDRNGLLIRYIDNGGNYITYEEYEFDADGNASKCVEYLDGEIYGWHEYDYDDNGNLINDNFYRTWADYDDYKFIEYDVYGNTILTIEGDTSGEYYRDENRLEYDVNGNEVRREHYYNDELGVTQEYGYDPDGNLISRNWIEDGNISRYVYEFEYDDQGNAVKVIEYNSDMDKMVGWTEKEYDLEGNLIRNTELTPDGSVWMMTEYEYGLLK